MFFALTRVSEVAVARSLVPLALGRLFSSSASSSSSSESIKIDVSATNRLKQLLSKSPDPASRDFALRIEVEGGGCRGFQYKFKINDSPITLDDK